jgi:hypothetical protein
MATRRLLKLLHFCGTAWFILAAAYVVVVALRQAGVMWWLIFSLSGNGAALLFLLVSAYLYALFRDNGRDSRNTVEHPLTNTIQYMILYSVIPFLGALAGLYCIFDTETSRQIALAVAMGTLGATFAFWIIIDPAISFAEMLLPESRKHRLMRHALAKAMREQKQLEHEQLLAQIEREEKIRYQHWQEVLGTQASKLAELAIEATEGSTAAEPAAVEIGLYAWQYGGFDCMKKLRQMAADICRNRGRENICDEYISLWWDGIGQWRHKLLA